MGEAIRKDPSVNRFALARSPERMLFVLGRSGDKKIAVRSIADGGFPCTSSARAAVLTSSPSEDRRVITI